MTDYSNYTTGTFFYSFLRPEQWLIWKISFLPCLTYLVFKTKLNNLKNILQKGRLVVYRVIPWSVTVPLLLIIRGVQLTAIQFIFLKTNKQMNLRSLYLTILHSHKGVVTVIPRSVRLNWPFHLPLHTRIQSALVNLCGREFSLQWEARRLNHPEDRNDWMSARSKIIKWFETIRKRDKPSCSVTLK